MTTDEQMNKGKEKGSLKTAVKQKLKFCYNTSVSPNAVLFFLDISKKPFYTFKWNMVNITSILQNRNFGVL